MLTLQPLRHLPLSAASGLVIIGDHFYVIADDELHLSVFSLRDENFHQRIQLFTGELPTKKKARKKHKPDLEALVHLPATADFPQGALLALGSGSKANRQRAVIVPFQADGTLDAQTITLDLSALYASLPVDDLNIEGAFIAGEQLVLMQRGNNRHEQSALVFLPLTSVSPYEVGGTQNTRDARGVGSVPRSGEGGATVHYTLPTIDGIPLGFTDGLYLPNGHILFSAVAENTDDSYNDGACVGAAIGEISAQGQLIRCDLLVEPHKVEGIAAVGDVLYAVTDADDAAVPARLLRINR